MAGFADSFGVSLNKKTGGMEMGGFKGINMWNFKCESVARIWVCGHCGTKIFYGRLVFRPKHNCFCGQARWFC